MKRKWTIMMTTESYDPNFNGTTTQVKEFPIPEEVRHWMEIKKSDEQKSKGMERTTINIVERWENEA